MVELLAVAVDGPCVFWAADELPEATGPGLAVLLLLFLLLLFLLVVMSLNAARVILAQKPEPFEL